MGLALDLSHRHFSRTLNNITIVGTWYNADGDQWRPCLVLIREGEDYNAIPCLVPLESAWIWDDRKGGGDPRTAALTAFRFAQALRLDSGDPNVPFRIATLIADHIDDLLKIPPRPESLERVVAEATITVRETGETHEATLVE